MTHFHARSSRRRRDRRRAGALSLLLTALVAAPAAARGPADRGGPCLIRKGCQLQRAALEPCKESQEPVQTAQALAAATATHEGQRVRARGWLKPGIAISTLLPATHAIGEKLTRCVNRAWGEMAVTGGPEKIFLRDPAAPARFRCSGDESLLCCPLLQQRVVVTGKLVVRPRYGGFPPELSLEVESLCRAR